MTRFRPCIDLHSGSVKQIVGSTLDVASPSSLRTNYVSEHPAAYYARLYRGENATGAHVIMLGPGNEEAVKEALAVWPGMLQVGGGINNGNAKRWIAEGASKVIVTSYLFPNGNFEMDNLKTVLAELGNDESKLVIDLSCRRKGSTWYVAMNKWQTITDFEVNKYHIQLLEAHCSEFLVHAADNEGLQEGIDEELVTSLAQWCSIPVTYAGGGRHIDDLERVKSLSRGKVDLTIGSALDIFGGRAVKFEDCIRWNKCQAA